MARDMVNSDSFANIRSQGKVELKKMHRFKNYGQNKIDTTIMASSHVFLAFLRRKMAVRGDQFPELILIFLGAKAPLGLVSVGKLLTKKLEISKSRKI